MARSTCRRSVVLELPGSVEEPVDAEQVSLWLSDADVTSQSAVEELHGARRGLTDVSLGPLATALHAATPTLVQLRFLDLSGNHLTDVACRMLADACSGLRSAAAPGCEHGVGLHTLLLNGNDIGPSGAEALAKSFFVQGSTAGTGCTEETVYTLALSGNQLGDQGVVAVASAVRARRCRVALQFSEVNCGGNGCTALAEAIPWISSLDLDYNSVPAGALLRLANAVAVPLRHLSIAGVVSSGSRGFFRAPTTQALGVALSKTGASLTYLGLANNDLQDEGLKPLVESLATQLDPMLQELDLTGNRLKDGNQLAQVLASPGGQRLRVLILENNHLNDLAVIAFSAGLAMRRGLRILNIARNRIGDAGAEALAQAIQSTPASPGKRDKPSLQYSKEEVDIWLANLSSQDPTALGGDNSSVEYMDLSFNMVTDEGAIAFASVASCGACLRRLNLYQTAVGDNGRLALEGAIQASQARVERVVTEVAEVFKASAPGSSASTTGKAARCELPSSLPLPFVVEGVELEPMHAAFVEKAKPWAAGAHALALEVESAQDTATSEAKPWAAGAHALDLEVEAARDTATSEASHADVSPMSPPPEDRAAAAREAAAWLLQAAPGQRVAPPLPASHDMAPAPATDISSTASNAPALLAGSQGAGNAAAALLQRSRELLGGLELAAPTVQSSSLPAGVAEVTPFPPLPLAAEPHTSRSAEDPPTELPVRAAAEVSAVPPSASSGGGTAIDAGTSLRSNISDTVAADAVGSASLPVAPLRRMLAETVASPEAEGGSGDAPGAGEEARPRAVTEAAAPQLPKNLVDILGRARRSLQQATTNSAATVPSAGGSGSGAGTMAPTTPGLCTTPTAEQPGGGPQQHTGHESYDPTAQFASDVQQPHWEPPLVAQQGGQRQNLEDSGYVAQVAMDQFGSVDQQPHWEPPSGAQPQVSSSLLAAQVGGSATVPCSAVGLEEEPEGEAPAIPERTEHLERQVEVLRQDVDRINRTVTTLSPEAAQEAIVADKGAGDEPEPEAKLSIATAGGPKEQTLELEKASGAPPPLPDAAAAGGKGKGKGLSTPAQSQLPAPPVPGKGKGKGKGKMAPPVPKGLPPKAGAPKAPGANPMGQAGSGVGGGAAPFHKKLYWKPLDIADSEDTLFSDTKETRKSRPSLDKGALTRMFEVESSKDLEHNRKSSSVLGRVQVKVQGIKLLSDHRARNVAIVLKRMSVPMKELIRILRELAWEATAVHSDDLEQIMEVIPTQEEAEKLREYKAPEDRSKLRDVEQMVLPLALLPRATARIRLICIARGARKEFGSCMRALAGIRAACNSIHRSAMLREVMLLALELGNYINHGDSSVGAKAITIGSLLTLRDFKAGRNNALHFLCASMLQSEPGRDVPEVLAKELRPVVKATQLQVQTLQAQVRCFVRDMEVTNAECKTFLHEYAPAKPKESQDGGQEEPEEDEDGSRMAELEEYDASQLAGVAAAEQAATFDDLFDDTDATRFVEDVMKVRGSARRRLRCMRKVIEKLQGLLSNDYADTVTQGHVTLKFCGMVTKRTSKDLPSDLEVLLQQLGEFLKVFRSHWDEVKAELPRYQQLFGGAPQV